ncbi:hypothetical protein [Streptomyces sp. NPDC056144]|uniref:hypothetical protein n=1 Tax=unclassified Streptomyces TaxID=2593676 RepID=UPI0035DBC848
MTTAPLHVGGRVKLAYDLRLTGRIVAVEETGDDRDDVMGDDEPDDAPSAGYLSLAVGLEGTVEHLVENREQSQAVREYERLASLLADFGDQMPPASRAQLVDQVAVLEPEWTAYQERGPLVKVRVRFDNGFVLSDTPAGCLTPA